MTVEEDERGRPVALAIEDRLTPAVASIEDVWEIADEWWRPTPIARRYYRVVMEDGVGATLFRDLVAGGWYRQRV